MGRRGRPKGSQVKQVPLQYDPSETVEEMAKELIKNYHPHLVNAEIAYLFKNKPITQKGKRVVATAKKCSPEVRALCSKDFVITVCYEAWNHLTDKQKLAVIDHELTHCMVDDDDESGERKCTIVPHDFEEFAVIPMRHGLVFSELVQMKSVVEGLNEIHDSPSESPELEKPETDLETVDVVANTPSSEDIEEDILGL